MADVGISDIAVEYVGNPRVIAEVEMLDTATDKLEAYIAGVRDDLRQDLVEQVRRARAQVAALRKHSRQAKLLVTHGSVEFELSDESEGTRLCSAIRR